MLVPIDLIDPNPFVQRVDPQDEVSELSESLDLHGQLTPVKLRVNPHHKGRYQLVYGHRRLAAAKRLKWTHIEADVRPLSDEQMIVQALIENTQRKNLSDYEEALIFHKLHKEYNKTYEEIATLVGKSKTYVAQHIAMLNLFGQEYEGDEEARQLLQKLTERQARIIARVRDPKERFQLAKLVIRENLCPKEADKLIGRPRHSLEEKGRKEAKDKVDVSDEEKIELLLDSLFDCMNRKFIHPLTTLRDEKDFSLFDDFPPYIKLCYREALRHNFDLLGKWRGTLQISYTDREIKVYGETALVTMYVHYKVHLYGKSFHSISRVSLFFVKKHNKWRIVHEHWSAVDPEQLVKKEGRAQTRFQPSILRVRKVR